MEDFWGEGEEEVNEVEVTEVEVTATEVGIGIMLLTLFSDNGGRVLDARAENIGRE